MLRKYEKESWLLTCKWSQPTKLILTMHKLRCENDKNQIGNSVHISKWV